MTTEALIEAQDEAQRFLLKVRQALDGARAMLLKNGAKEMYLADGKANAAVKRASLDLTRKLAEMRRSR